MGDKWSGTPELPLNYIFNVSYVDSNEEFSVMYGLTNASIMSMMFLDESGYLQRSTWHEDSARWVVVWSSSALASQDMSPCQHVTGIDESLRNCSCSAYTSEGGGICITWYGNLTDTRVFSNGGLDLSIGGNIQVNDEEKVELPIFDIVTISRATDKFCDTNKIGEGGFGPIYKGLLSTGKEIAVKQLSTTSKQGLNEFKSEMTLIAKLQYCNLVMLLGCCIHGEERMLIYEYMPNGSLDSLIFDFGLARTFGGDQSSATTRRVVGTYGYMSPEYVIDGLFSIKSDVFSFGVMILEILSGKSNRRFHHPDHNFNLLGHAWTLWIEGKACELLDPLVEGSFSMSEVLRCIQIGLLCVQKCPKDRPTIALADIPRSPSSPDLGELDTGFFLLIRAFDFRFHRSRFRDLFVEPTIFRRN
ncbi:G-type lectin S-receptor-like serine/threonine-protein kinase At1g11410 [Camellia sinensis]|uniref:G-type lectin S-receptor-like serine/threonine-protein kinase At1g11410 n=1 Tax=Camellia sinensis TaxID=4442 RepID=UPI0010369176|nr:G-type lectin S-receptor-like serine/threonine-protein kinase At1g11410 [Camellia sinensis]